nr:hypothetical protein [Tanacetum cinerariifolium]
MRKRLVVFAGGGAPLTIFYNGTISVFDMSSDQAKQIMKIADNGSSGLKNACEPAEVVKAKINQSSTANKGILTNVKEEIIEEVFRVVGAAISLALKRVPNMILAVRKIIIRTLKMLFSGIILQGWYSHAPDELVYRVDMKIIRCVGSFMFGGLTTFLIYYMITTFFLYVLDWNFTTNIDGVSKSFTVKCGMRGYLEPTYNAVGYVDREVRDTGTIP